MLNIITAILIAIKIGNCNLYPNVGIVAETDRVTDTVTITDVIGESWEFYGVEDWEIGDRCAVIMNDMGTEIIYDDRIVSVKYIWWEGK